jgi:hypothetical protein
MTEPWVAHDHILDTPPKNSAQTDRTAVAIVMFGIAFGFILLTVKEVIVGTAGRLKRLKQSIRP